jgi:hypothetical protein
MTQHDGQSRRSSIKDGGQSCFATGPASVAHVDPEVVISAPDLAPSGFVLAPDR